MAGGESELGATTLLAHVGIGCGFELGSLDSEVHAELSVSLQRSAQGLEVPSALCASTVLHLAAAPSIFRPRPGDPRERAPRFFLPRAFG